jgi:YfiH family protein
LNLSQVLGDVPERVLENQRRFAQWVGYPPERLYSVNQVHGRRALSLYPERSPAAVQREDADALVAAPTNEPRALAVRTADCVPLVLADPETRAVAAVHAGWRGLVAGVIESAVEMLCGSAVPRQRLVAAIFPHIGACCYEVGDDVAQQLQAAAGPAADVVTHPGGGKPHVALGRVVHAQLAALELDLARVDQVAGCTYCDADSCFSFRRDGRGGGWHMTAIVAG